MLYMFLLYHDPNVSPPSDIMERHFPRPLSATARATTSNRRPLLHGTSFRSLNLSEKCKDA